MRLAVLWAALVAVAGLNLSGCAPPATDGGSVDAVSGTGAPAGVPLDPPAEIGSFAPNLAAVADGLAATWLEPFETPAAGASHRLRFARFDGQTWSEPISIAEGSDFFANWADFPALVEAGDGTLYAHWLAKTAADTYAYSVFLARSRNGGAHWEPLGKLNSDDTPTEHGFVAFVAEDEGARAFWLDGREMVDKRPMTMRSARLDEAGRTSDVVDERVCECCGTDAVMTQDGPIVVYRDRSDDEVRDIYAVRRLASGWTEPSPVHTDGWRIEGCPVNGPAVDAEGVTVAVAWFTAAQQTQRVQVAFSTDSGGSFGRPIVVDASQGESLVLGRVDLSMNPDGTVWVSWVAQTGGSAEVRLRLARDDGSLGAVRRVAETSPARASGFPILQEAADSLFMAWVEVGEDRSASRIRIRAL